jgi:predicted TIM-barrel fold metal-dependent hydrolase
VSTKDRAAWRAKLGHPVIDSDGHTVELAPAWLEAVEKHAGARVRERLQAAIRQMLYSWYELTSEQRLRSRALRFAWWATPARNTLDRATATLPRLLHERMDDLGIDFSVLYPSLGLLLFFLEDEELRRAACRGLNAYHAELYAPYADRMTPAAAIPMHTPGEALDELRFAVRERGMKVVMLAGNVRRVIPEAQELGEAAARFGTWIDTLGLDSAHDYDPVWRACAELGVSPTFHSSGAGWQPRASISSYVYNHIGQFATGGEATCRSLFLGGVTHRFPQLRFAFLEGGAAWGCALYADLLGHWEKRNRTAIADLDPARLDQKLLLELFERYPEPAYRGKLDQVIGSFGLHLTPEPPEMLDEFRHCSIERADDLRERFAERFYFGCEADDPLNAWAFDERTNPLGARLRAIFSSDIGHWDVPDMRHVLAEAYELVERGLLSVRDFRDFTFTFPVELWTANNPDFFRGTAVEDDVRREQAEHG